jgi:hypothetical protein
LINNFISFFQNLPTYIQSAYFFVFFIYLYQFIVYYCWRPPKKNLVFFTATTYFVCLYFSYFVLKWFFPSYFNDSFNEPLLARLSQEVYQPILKESYRLIVLIPFIEIFRRFAYIVFKPREVKHGAVFTPGKRSSGEGTEFAGFDLSVVPKIVRDFSHKSDKKMVLPYDRLSRTTVIIGDMGCGKTRLMFLLLKDIQKHYPDIPILIHDRKGEWLRTDYDKEKDLIFAPFDRRSFKWDIWNDFKTHPELRHSMISSAVASHAGGINDHNKFFTDSSIELLKDNSRGDNLETLRNFLFNYKQTTGKVNPGASILSSALPGLRDLATIQLAKSDKIFGIDYLLKHKGKIFMLNSPLCDAEQEGCFALMLSAFFMQAISLPDVPTGELRAFVLLDEALTFKMPPKVELAVYTLCRSKGLAIIAAAQRLPDKQANESGMWADFNNQMIVMKSKNSATNELLSKKIGTITYDERQESFSTGEKNNSSRTSSKTQREHAIMRPEDFSLLQNRQVIYLHEDGYGAGTVLNSHGTQSDAPPFEYVDRTDVGEFMKGL